MQHICAFHLTDKNPVACFSRVRDIDASAASAALRGISNRVLSRAVLNVHGVEMALKVRQAPFGMDRAKE